MSGHHPALTDFVPLGREGEQPRQLVDALGGTAMQRTLAALRPPPPMTPPGSWAGRELCEEFVPLDSNEAAEATLVDIRDLCVALAQRGARGVPGSAARPADYAEASGRMRSLVIQATTTMPQQAAAPAGSSPPSGRAPDGMSTILESGSADDRRREACVPLARLHGLQRIDFILAEARAAQTPSVLGLSPAQAVARLVDKPEPLGSSAFAFHFSSATTEDKASGSIAISIKGARGALVAELRTDRLRGMGGELGRNITEEHKDEVKVFFDKFIYGRIESRMVVRYYAWVMADQDHATVQGTLDAGRPGDPDERMDFQRAMPLAFDDMARVWGGAAGCSTGPDGVFGLRDVFKKLELRMEMERIHTVFNDFYKGIFSAFARCRELNGLNYRQSELPGEPLPHRVMVGGYLRPHLINVVETYKTFTVDPVKRDQKESERVDAKVDSRMAKNSAAGQQVQALDRRMDDMQRQLLVLKRAAPTQTTALTTTPPPPPPGGPPTALVTTQQQQKAQRVQPALAPIVAAQAPTLIYMVPKDPGDFTEVVSDPVKLVQRYEWTLHQAAKVASCGWMALFDTCRNATPAAGKRQCPRCTANLAPPDKEAFLTVAASGMAPNRAAEVAAVKAKRGWG